MPVTKPKSKHAADAIAGAVGATALAITGLIQPWEGRELKSYREVVGIWTICWGETKNVGPDITRSPAQCGTVLLSLVEKDYCRRLTVCIANYTTLPRGLKASLR